MRVAVAPSMKNVLKSIENTETELPSRSSLGRVLVTLSKKELIGSFRGCLRE